MLTISLTELPSCKTCTGLFRPSKIGPKSAQRMILELQDKLKKEGPDSLISVPQNTTVKEEALSALVMLGFNKAVAEKSLGQIISNSSENLSVEQLIKVALKTL